MKLMTKVDIQIVVHYMIYFTYDNLKEKCALREKEPKTVVFTFPTGLPSCVNGEFLSNVANDWDDAAFLLSA